METTHRRSAGHSEKDLVSSACPGYRRLSVWVIWFFINSLSLATVLALTSYGEMSSADSPSQTDTSAHDIADGKRGLAGWWKFDENSGTLAADSSGNGNTATIHNGGWADGKIGAALQMKGGNDGIVTVPLSDSLRSTADAITVMGWVYRTVERNMSMVGHGYPYLFLGFHGTQFKWQIHNTNGKTVSCYADPEYGTTINRWFHLAGTYDGKTLLLYVNGMQICRQRLWREAPIGMPDMPFTLSGYLRETGEIFDETAGRIDDVRIYNRTLSAADIRSIYEAGK
jgi:hypothetical protein